MRLCAINEHKFIYLPCLTYMMLYGRLMRRFCLFSLIHWWLRTAGEMSSSFIHRQETGNYLCMKIMTWEGRKFFVDEQNSVLKRCVWSEVDFELKKSSGWTQTSFKKTYNIYQQLHNFHDYFLSFFLSFIHTRVRWQRPIWKWDGTKNSLWNYSWTVPQRCFWLA